jgi:CRP-like cAMP-binding protein/signal transduction histidine kinase
MRLSDILQGKQLAEIEPYLETVAFAEGDYIFEQGEEGREAFFIESGTVRIDLHVGDAGEQAVLACLEAGQLLGEFCLLEKGARSASAVAGTDVVARKLTRHKFERLCREKPDVGIDLMRYVSRELIWKTRSTNESLEGFLNQILEYYPGLLFVLEQNGRVGRYTSGVAREVFGHTQGKSIAEVLYPGDEKARKCVESVLELATSRPEMCASLTKDLTPTLFQVGEVQYDLNYHVTRVKDGDVDSMLLLGADVTETLREKARAEAARNEANMITSIAKDLPGYLSFVDESSKLIEEVGEDVKRIDRSTIARLFRKAHTIKGASASCGLYQIDAAAHELESELSRLRDLLAETPNYQLSGEETETVRDSFSRLVAVIEREHRRMRQLFHLEDDTLRVTEQQLEQAMAKGLTAHDTFVYLSRRTLRELLANTATRTLERAQASLILQGRCKEFSVTVEATDEHLTERGLTLLERCLTHVIRNAADHGIEEIEEREMIGKPKAGTIELCQRAADDGTVRIVIRDDGRGIATARLLERARQAGILPVDETPPQDGLCDLIFHPGLSTKEDVTALSGRGIGMDAVRTFVREAGGDVSVRSVEGRGLAVNLTLPSKILFDDAARSQKSV